MSTELYEFDCDECGQTVVTRHHPRRSDQDPLMCPDCSAVNVDYTVDPDEFEDATVTQIE